VIATNEKNVKITFKKEIRFFFSLPSFFAQSVGQKKKKKNMKKGQILSSSSRSQEHYEAAIEHNETKWGTIIIPYS
jgi:hypothetical protein